MFLCIINLAEMKIAILANEVLKNDLIIKGVAPGAEILWVNAVEELLVTNADVYIDLLFTKNGERVNQLSTLLSKPVFINCVTHTLKEIGRPFIRLNAWPGFLKRKMVEIAVANKEYEEIVKQVLTVCQWPYQLVPDIPGMISARVIAMIVNEAYFAWGEGVSTKAEIDIAMKLGTNYPFGPFEWAESIGIKNIYELLSHLYQENERYIISGAMIEEVSSSR